VITTLSVGLYPALVAARGAARAQVAESGLATTTGRAHDRLRRALVIGQVAASLVLLTGAALLASSFMNLLAVDGGVANAGDSTARRSSARTCWLAECGHCCSV